METKSMIQVTVDGAVRQYPLGTPYQAVADDVQAKYPHDILLVNREGKDIAQYRHGDFDRLLGFLREEK